MLLSRLVETSARVAATSSRLAKIDFLADCLRDADGDEVAVAVAFLSGELTQRQIGVGWASLRDVAPAADTPTLTVADVDAAFARVGATTGAGSSLSSSAARPQPSSSFSSDCSVANSARARWMA